MSAAGTPRYVTLSRAAKAGTPLVLVGPGPLSVAWMHPEEQVDAVGLGVAGEGIGPLCRIGEAPPVAPPGPFFGGWAFDAARPWKGFAAERWVLPEVLGHWDGQRTWLSAFGPQGTSEAELAARLDEVEEVAIPALQPSARRLPEDPSPFHALVAQALEELEQGRTRKLVVARSIEVEADAPWSERQVLASLVARFPSCRTFLLRGSDGSAFLGASPELLCEVRGALVRAEALAGTAAPGKGARLLSSAKDRREHETVAAHVRAVLGRFVSELRMPDEPGLRQLANVVHLHTPAEGLLRAGASAFDLSRALHPTPAVAGVPIAGALEWLRQKEGFARGWYAGVVGAAGPDAVVLAVALRSALLHQTRASVFVGAGVVEGSTPRGEWLETERKARALLPALGVHHG
ncbi:MAG: chorismate-binding protein [Deltaproteobacteria bacterium]|nr:chorismate-binding protein [Deltaproteobacteria bacterium]